MSKAVETYRDALPVYEAFAARLQNLVDDLLSGEGIRVHFVESRAKSPESLQEKISRPGKSYSDPLKQIPDLVGVRVVLYYQDDVDRVGELIRREFEVLEVERSHQVEKYLPDQFGYLSAHYIVCLNDTRSALIEWKTVTGLRAEIQVRTVLQHSWAAVSHALQYKREGDVPVSLRRKLFRLAGLFELADEEFMELRDSNARLAELSREIVRRNDELTPLDAPVVREYITKSKRFKGITKSMRDMGYVFEASSGEYDYLGDVIEEFERLRLSSIRDLSEILARDYGAYLSAICGDEWHVSDEFALLLLLIGAYPDEFSVEHLEGSGGWHPDIASRVIKGAAKHRPA